MNTTNFINIITPLKPLLHKAFERSVSNYEQVKITIINIILSGDFSLQKANYLRNGTPNIAQFCVLTNTMPTIGQFTKIFTGKGVGSQA